MSSKIQIQYIFTNKVLWSVQNNKVITPEKKKNYWFSTWDYFWKVRRKSQEQEWACNDMK